MKPGEVVLMHDGGGSRAGTVAAAKTVIQERLDEGWTFTLPAVTLAPSQPPGTAVISADFEDGLEGWVPRATVTARAPSRSPRRVAHGGAQSALADRAHLQGHGIGYDVTGVLIAGTSYEYRPGCGSPRARPADDIWLSLARTVGGSTSFDTLAQFTGITNSGWTQVTGDLPDGRGRLGAALLRDAVGERRTRQHQRLPRRRHRRRGCRSRRSSRT